VRSFLPWGGDLFGQRFSDPGTSDFLGRVCASDFLVFRFGLGWGFSAQRVFFQPVFPRGFGYPPDAPVVGTYQVFFSSRSRPVVLIFSLLNGGVHGIRDGDRPFFFHKSLSDRFSFNDRRRAFFSGVISLLLSCALLRCW